jgi:hypothetical protein
VSQNIIEASCEALADSLELYLLRARDAHGPRDSQMKAVAEAAR